jgi:hypothetical protein
MQTERSLPELTRDLASHVGDLMRNEVRLARAETVESLKGMGAGIIRAALGVALAGAAVCLGLFALAFALAEIMPQWAAALLSAGIGGVLAYLLIKNGLKAISIDRIELPRTTAQVSRDLRLINKDMNP